MTDHEMVLLRAAVEACNDQGYDFHVYVGLGFVAEGFRVDVEDQSQHSVEGVGTTLDAALTALLRDLGADVPEWPSEERVAHLRDRYVINRAVDLPLSDLLALRGGS